MTDFEMKTAFINGLMHDFVSRFTAKNPHVENVEAPHRMIHMFTWKNLTFQIEMTLKFTLKETGEAIWKHTLFFIEFRPKGVAFHKVGSAAGDILEWQEFTIYAMKKVLKRRKIIIEKKINLEKFYDEYEVCSIR